MAGFVALFDGIARQPEARGKLLGLAAYAGNLAALSDPKVVVARATSVAAVITGAARQPEIVGTLRAAAFDLLGAYVAPDGTGSKAAAILALVATTEAVLDGIARQPEMSNDLIYLTKLLLEDGSAYDPEYEYETAYEPAYEPVPLTGTIGVLAIERLLAAFNRAVARQPEARSYLAAALLQLSGIVAPTLSE